MNDPGSNAPDEKDRRKIHRSFHCFVHGLQVMYCIIASIIVKRFIDLIIVHEVFFIVKPPDVG